MHTAQVRERHVGRAMLDAQAAASSRSAARRGGRYRTACAPSSTSPEPPDELASPVSRLCANGCVCTSSISRSCTAIFATKFSPYCEAVAGESSDPRYPCSNCRYPTGGSVAGFVTVGRDGFACGVCPAAQPASAVQHSRMHTPARLPREGTGPRIFVSLSLALCFCGCGLRALLRSRGLRRRLARRFGLRRSLRLCHSPSRPRSCRCLLILPLPAAFAAAALRRLRRRLHPNLFAFARVTSHHSRRRSCRRLRIRVRSRLARPDVDPGRRR